MALNFLNLNEQKTEVTVFGPCDHYDLGPLENYFKKSFARNLGVIFDCTVLKYWYSTFSTLAGMTTAEETSSETSDSCTPSSNELY